DECREQESGSNRQTRTEQAVRSGYRTRLTAHTLKSRLSSENDDGRGGPIPRPSLVSTCSVELLPLRCGFGPEPRPPEPRIIFKSARVRGQGRHLLGPRAPTVCVAPLAPLAPLVIP